MESIFEAKGLLGPGSVFIVGLPDPFRLKEELQTAQSIKIATAFAHWSGWQLLLPHIKKAKGTVKLLTGLSFCQTEPRVLYDWCARSRGGWIEARLYADKRTTFHPKVLLVKNSRRAFAVVGSGNLSSGGFLKNIECGLFSDDASVYSSVDAWFEKLFCDDRLTKQLREPDIRRYKKRYDAAKRANKEVVQFQEDAEDDIGKRHQAGLRNWKQAVDLAKAFFKSEEFRNDHAPGRAGVVKQIKAALRYPTFDFDKDGLDDFYKIKTLGHLIEIRKPEVWRQRSKLQTGLRHLVDDSKSIEARLNSVLHGKYQVNGVGLNFLTKVLAVHNPLEFAVFNKPVVEALKAFQYEPTRGYSKAQHYIEFADLMRKFLKESGGRSTVDLDGFFYQYWNKQVRPRQ